ncbi:hypothetical protein DIPPA_30768 [Diplonema papillatum]|nr:hypothetical protein DIPPA_30768 [Diplonema papillatum]
MRHFSAMAMLAGCALVDAQCSSCGSETCYVSTWAVPCFTPANGQTGCTSFGGAWCGAAPPPPPPVPPPTSSGCSACASGETCHVPTWTVPCFTPEGGCTAVGGSWCSGGGTPATPSPPIFASLFPYNTFFKQT